MEPDFIAKSVFFDFSIKEIKVKQGMQGLLVHDRKGAPVVFVVCRPATRYYQVMTRAEWMPSLIDEVI